MTQTTNQRLLRKAAELMGKEELATRLNVPQDLLKAWLSGQVTMPDRKLIPLANVLEQFSTKP